MSLTSIRLPEHLARDLDEIAARRRTTRSDLIREAVAEYCAAHRGDADADPLALLERLVTYRGSGKRDLGSRSEEHLREFFGERRRRRSR